MDVVGVSATNGGTIELDGDNARAVVAQADNRSKITAAASDTSAAEECNFVPTWWRELLTVTVITASAVTAVALIRRLVGKQ